MCLAVPGQVTAIEGDDPLTRIATVNFLGVVKAISLALVPEAQLHDYILVHAGVAITVLDDEQARQTLDYLAQLDDLPATGAPSE